MAVSRMAVSKMSFSQMPVGKMSFSQMSVCEMSVCQMYVCQMSSCQMSACQMSACQMSVWQLQCVVKMSLGQMPFGRKTGDDHLSFVSKTIWPTDIWSTQWAMKLFDLRNYWIGYSHSTSNQNLLTKCLLTKCLIHSSMNQTMSKLKVCWPNDRNIVVSTKYCVGKWFLTKCQS